VENWKNSTWYCCYKISYIVQAIDLKLCSYVVLSMSNNLPKFQRLLLLDARTINFKIVWELLEHPLYVIFSSRKTSFLIRIQNGYFLFSVFFIISCHVMYLMKTEQSPLQKKTSPRHINHKFVLIHK
jgi:hypothetical protein